MRLNQIRDFVAVIEAGSISAAARQLGVSQPGLTKSVGTLEAELAVSLLQRTPRGVSPTRYGRAFYVRARAAHSELEKAQHEMAQMGGARSGHVAIGFGPFVAAQLVPQAVVQFRRQFPAVELRLLEGFAHATLPLVRDETLDMVVSPRLPGLRNDPAIRFRPIFHHNQIVVARRGHPLAKVRRAAELVGAEWLSFEPRAVTDKALTHLGVPAPRQITQCESLNVLFALLADSDMLAVASHRILALPNAGRSIQEITVSDRMATLTVGLYSRADAPLTPPAAALARLIVEVGRGMSAAA